ncbi:hypothetical protein KO02_10460 [Sphingobacterium sp. ML3W]|uniref:WG repeat-containing protein n=1 Tax=Sphingobacterium sp. ML3W TaxID=1538644 RepID=UPI0004F6A163|nr:WG repeat-containing protein [Sphingobacterium sp. ML3W]AIM37071.1 hypothetical protein KO02_10460 [Sphingobacterium sp. ML3W]
MKKLTLTIAAVCLTSLTVLAQSTKFFRIDYSVHAEELLDDHVRAWVNKDFTRISYTHDESHVEITNKKSNRTFLLIPQSQEYLILNDGVKNDYSQIPIQYIKGKEKNIAGYNCKLALITFEPNEDTDTRIELEVWYTEQIPFVSWSEYNFLEMLPGAPLSIMVAGNGFMASQVKTEELATSLFEIPEDYSPMEVDSAVGYTENQVAEDRYFFVDEHGAYGLRNENNEIIIQPKYANIGYFQDGVAIVYDSADKQGAINLQGQEIIPVQYDYLTYSEDDAKFLCGNDDRYGLLDADGNVFIPAKYEMISFPKEGLLQFTINNKMGLMNEKEQIIIPAKYEMIFMHNKDYFVTMEDLTYALHSIKDNKKIASGYDYLGLPDQGNIFLAQKNGKFGYIDNTGKTVIPFKFATAIPFEDNMAMVSEDEDSYEYYFIDTKGQKIVAVEAAM